jgi:hypothetical protein
MEKIVWPAHNKPITIAMQRVVQPAQMDLPTFWAYIFILFAKIQILTLLKHD